MKISIKTITPLHIWTWKKITPFEYVVEDDNFLRINYKKLYKLLEEKKRKNLQEALNSSSLLYARYYVNLYFSNLSDNTKDKLIIYKIDVSEQFKSIYNIKIQDKKKHNEANRLEVDEAIKNFDWFYIPWSSLKWCIRTIVLYDIAKNTKDPELNTFFNQFNDIKNLEDNQKKNIQIRIRSRSDTNSKIECSLLNYQKVWQDPFRFLIIRDSNVVGFENWIVEKNYRLWQKGKLHTTKEYIKSETFFTVEIKVNNKLFNLSKEKLNINWNIDFSDEKEFLNYVKQISDDFYKERFELIKKFTEEQLVTLKSKEQNRWTKAEIQMYKKLLQNIDDLQNQLYSLKDNEFLLNLGFGWGYWFKKLDDLLQPKTYNFVWNEMLNGFIKLTFTEW